jgi:glycosyltransferase involved in cell wall biosynthesis
MLCPNYNFVAHGRICELCLGGNYFHAVTKGCHAGPRSSAVVLAAEAYLHSWLRTYQRCIDLFLAPTEFVRDKLISAGFSAQQIAVLPHFQSLPPKENLVPEKGYILYFGRLSAEKGLDELLHAMARLPHIPLVIAGEGPERERLEALARDLKLTQVLFAGMVGGTKLEHLIAGCSFSVFPSRAYETLGKSILESYAWGRPVVASDLGSRREMVEQGVTGILYPPGDLEQLVEAIDFLFSRSTVTAHMGAQSRSRLQTRHDPERHLDALTEIYARMATRKPQIAVPELPKPSPQPSPARLRVAFIGGRGLVSKYSGIESYYEQVGTELTRMGHEVTVYCRTYFTPPITEYQGIRVRRLPTIRSKHLETFAHTFLSTMHAMFSGYDVVHYHCLGPALFSFLPRLTGKKTVVTVQGLDWQRRKWGRIASRVLRWGEAAAVALPDATMVVSQTLQRYYWGQYGRPTIYIPNGASLRTKRTPKRLAEWGLTAQNYVLYLGRFSPEKNCHLLIEAFKDIPTGMKLVLAGGSSHSDEYVDRLRRHESAQIHLLPWVSGEDLDELLSNAAVFVLPSDLEGLSLALLDAMAAGVCVLTSDIPENRELVADVGFTFRGGDRLDLTRQLGSLICNPELRQQLAAKAEEQIHEHYLWPDVARSIANTYYKVLQWTHPADPLVANTEQRSSTA